jgi:hypothetical protein
VTAEVGWPRGRGTSTAPDISRAVCLSHLIDDISAVASGQTTTPTAGWP